MSPKDAPAGVDFDEESEAAQLFGKVLDFGVSYVQHFQAPAVLDLRRQSCAAHAGRGEGQRQGQRQVAATLNAHLR